MGFWLFGRKHRRDSESEEPRSGGVLHEKMAQNRPGQSQNDACTSGRGTTRTDSQRRKGDRPRRLTKTDRTITRDQGSASLPPSTTAPRTTKSSTFPQNLREKSETFPTPPTNPFISPAEQPQNDVYQHNPASQSSIGQDLFSVNKRVPTLKAKRASNDAGMPRRKSSKRKADDHAREQEIRAMSSPIPIPTKRSTYSGGPLRRDTKKVSGGLNRHLERPISDVSLPIPESIDSSVGDMPEHQHSFKVGMLDMLSPRPTVRYTDNPRYQPNRSQNTSRTSDKRPTVPEEDFKSKRRIEDLADSLDASGLRELMERDRKRKEKKERSDQEKLERRLQRRAERQKLQEQNKPEGAGPAQPGPSSGEASGIGLGIAAAVAAAKEDEDRQVKQPDTMDRGRTGTPRTWLDDPPKENIPPEDPFADERADEVADVPVPLEKRSSIGPDRSFLRAESPMDARLSQASIATSSSPPRSPAQLPRDRRSMSQISGLHRELTPDIPEHTEYRPTRRDSQQSGAPVSSWTTFFKRGGSRRKRSSADRGRTTPSEFSNTSRESFARQGPPPTIPPRSFRRSGTPQRTQSKFREDLPDFPISPPDSRVQSPEAVAIPTDRTSGEAEAHEDARGGSTVLPEQTHSEALGIHGAVTDIESPDQRPTNIMSQSMASVDSEGSWLSGGRANRASLGLAPPQRQSDASLHQKLSTQTDEEGLANDEYLSRLTPGPENRRDSGSAIRRASSTILGHPEESDEEPEVPTVPRSYLEEDPDTKWHGGVARQPTLIRQSGRVKSREGLLNDFNDMASESSQDEDSDELITPGSAKEHEGRSTPVLHAKSVDYGRGHARHISAGSAKLLDIGRASIDSNRRLSSLPQESSKDVD